jgi:integrase
MGGYQVPLKLVRRPGSDNWYLRGTVRGISVFESTGTDRQDAAEQIRIQRESALLAESIHGRKATVTFLQAAVSYMESGGSPRFIGKVAKDTGRWSGLIGHFDKTRLSAIGQSDLDRAAAEMFPTAGPETRNRQCYTPFIAVWNHAARNGWAEERAWRRPRKPKGTAVRNAATRAGTRPVAYEHAARFVAEMSAAPGWVMTTLFYTGMRPIELFALRADDIDVAGRWITVRNSKSGEPRGVPMHNFLAPLMAFLKERGDPIFRTPRGDAYPVTEEAGGQLKTAIAGARRRSGIADVSPYTGRHTVSTQLVVNGVHAYVKDQILGHAVTDMSRRYTNIPQRKLVDAINTLPVPEAWRSIRWMTEFSTAQRRLVRWKKVQKPRTAVADAREGE